MKEKEQRTESFRPKFLIGLLFLASELVVDS